MPDWTAPFHLPKFTDEEFKEMRVKYVAKYGYSIRIPDFDDIIITDMYQPMSEAEKKLWKQRRYKDIPPYRLAEIRKHKDKKRERFLGMLASPTPDILMNIGSIMTSLDDCQDALITLGFLGRVVLALVPKVVGRVLLGPVSWLITAAELLNFATVATGLVNPTMKGKRAVGNLVDKNPLGVKAKALRAKKLLQFMPDSADIIQGLQVTASVFGFGICLGPIIGLAQDLISGFVRTLMGDEVIFNAPNFAITNMLGLACQSLLGSSYLMSFGYQTDEPMITDAMLAAYLGNQVLAPYLKEWNPIDNVKDIQNINFMAPIPKDPLTIEIIEEAGLDVLSTCGWPNNGQMWTKIGDFWEYGKDIATQNVHHMMDINKGNRRGQAIGVLCKEVAFHSLANLVGEENVVYDYTATTKAINVMFHAGYSLSEHTSPAQLGVLEGWLDELDAIDDGPTWKELSLFCTNNSIPLVPFGSETSPP